MKNRVLEGVVLLIICIIMFCGCGNSGEQASQVPSPSPLTAEVEENTSAIVEDKEEAFDDISDISESETEEVIFQIDENTFITDAELQEMKKYSQSDAYTEEIPCFYFGDYCDGALELYGKSDFSGYLLKADNQLYTIPVWISKFDPEKVYINDIDNDGNPEYVIAICVESGTGCFLEELFVIDPDTTEKVFTCDIYDKDIIGQDVISNIVTEVNLDENRVDYYYMDNGKRVAEGSFDIPENPYDDGVLKGVAVSDYFAKYYYEDGRFICDLEFGMLWGDAAWPMFEYVLTLTFDIDYADGSFSAANPRFCFSSYDEDVD